MTESKARKDAIKQIKRKRNFRNSLASYVFVNAFLIVIWAVAGGGFFWPVFVIAGWGLGILMQAWKVYGQKPISETEIEHEIQHQT